MNYLLKKILRTYKWVFLSIILLYESHDELIESFLYLRIKYWNNYFLLLPYAYKKYINEKDIFFYLL